MHIHTDGCMGVCAFGDCFLQCTICSINLTHFKVIHMGREILLGKSSKLWKEIKNVSAGEKEKVSKTSSVCHFNALPMSCLKPKQLKSPKRTVFCLKVLPEKEVLCYALHSGLMCAVQQKMLNFTFPKDEMPTRRGKKLHLWKKTQRPVLCLSSLPASFPQKERKHSAPQKMTECGLKYWKASHWVPAPARGAKALCEPFWVASHQLAPGYWESNRTTDASSLKLDMQG